MATAYFQKRTSSLQILIVFLLAIAFVYVAKPVVVPLALAILLAFILTPIVSVLEGSGLRRIPAVLLAVIFSLALFGAVAWTAGAQVNRLAHELPEHKEKIQKKMTYLRGAAEGTFDKLFKMVRELNEEANKQEGPAADTAPSGKEVIVVHREQPSNFERLISFVVPVLEPLATAGFVVIMVLFMLVNREDLRNRLISVLGHGHLTGTTRALVDASHRLSRYLLTQLLLNVAFGVVFALGLLAIGVPYAFLWGFLITVLRFIPYIGTWIAVSFPLLLSLAIFPGWTPLLLVLALSAVLDLITANVIEPLVFGQTTGVTPIALLIAAAVWTWIWGPIGLVLSTPLTVCLVVLGQHIPRLRFLTLLMGSQPPLKTHVNFYQRLLAKDLADATRVAMDQAKTGGLAALCDEVLIPALVLARRDRKHNGLTPAEEEEIYQATKDILAQVEPDAPTAAPGETPALSQPSANGHAEVPMLILGCPAHHKAEELTLQCLDQIMRPDGCRVEIVSNDAMSIDVQDRVRVEKPKLALIAVLPPGGVLEARYLCQRLRRQFKRLPIVIGYWGEPRDFDRLLLTMRSAGASSVTTSLAQARGQIRAILGTLAPQPILEPVVVSQPRN